MKMADTISKKSIVTAGQDQVSQDLDGEEAIVNLKSGACYLLNSVGSKIWDFIQEPTQVEKVRDELVKLYGLDTQRAEQDVLALLEELMAEGLIEVSDPTT